MPTKRRSASSRSASPSIDVFTLGEVAKVLSVPSSRIKNWTIGRPFHVAPSIVTGRGKGSRNLYSLEDVYFFALLNRLDGDGLSTDLIGWVVTDERVRTRLTARSVDSSSFAPAGRRSRNCSFAMFFDARTLRRRNIASGTYVLNVNVVAEVKRRIAQLASKEVIMAIFKRGSVYWYHFL